MDDFGVILPCYRKDYDFAKGCCASIRYFLGDVPICLIVDGDFSVAPLEKTYDLNVLYRSQVSQDVLRDKKYGSSTAMIAFWESPWKNFLYLDADTVVWGDILRYSDFDKFDFIADDPGFDYSDKAILQWIFNFKELNRFFPDFDWRKHRYFCAGTYFAKKDLFSLDEWAKLLEFRRNNPETFYGWDQGLLNFMVFRAAQSGKIRLAQKDMQVIISDTPRETLESRFPMHLVHNNKECDEAAILHWAGQKPFLSRSKVYPDPMTFFRRKYLRDSLKFHRFFEEITLQIEDFKIYRSKLAQRVLTGKTTSGPPR
jgi:lipopolysaccharide biosynthesis glycosyltransferase